MWYAAELNWSTLGAVFTGYAVLGDDIVITDTLVAKRYEECLQELKVEISRQKSMISDSGAFEFAKRFRVKGGTVDLSQVSIRTKGGASSGYDMEFHHKEGRSRLPVYSASSYI